jgi:hypothetical protein
MPARKKPRRVWGRTRRGPKPKIPAYFKERVGAAANRLVEEVLKPRYVVPPPAEPQWNYKIDIYTTWFRGYLYFCATYACPGPNALSPTFETRFARMEYAGEERFHLAFMRYTGEWIEVYRDFTADQALNAIRDDPYFSAA